MEERIYPVYEAAAAYRAVVFVHFGLLKVGIRDKVCVPGRFDLRFSNPIDLSGPAADFPNTPFVIPHFGCGFFREALLIGAQRANVYLDTSSSNTWATLLPTSADAARPLRARPRSAGREPGAVRHGLELFSPGLAPRHL